MVFQRIGKSLFNSSLCVKFSGCCLQIISAEKSHHFNKSKCSASVFSEQNIRETLKHLDILEIQ